MCRGRKNKASIEIQPVLNPISYEKPSVKRRFSLLIVWSKKYFKKKKISRLAIEGFLPH